MFYRIQVEDHIRVAPKYFGLDLTEALLKSIKVKFDGMIDAELGIVVDVLKVSTVGDGNIIFGDGASYYTTTFELLAFKPEQQEVISGKIKDIADFGAFITMGPIDGMIHISQTIDDFVSFAKDKVLTGRDSKKSLKVGDSCRARVIAVSFKDVTNPKIGLTMRQPGLGKLEWINEEKDGTASSEAKAALVEKKDDKKSKEKKK